MCVSADQHVHCLQALFLDAYEHARALDEEFGSVSGEPTEGCSGLQCRVGGGKVHSQTN